MEAAPLTRAHAHVRSAVNATESCDINQASFDHELAADEFRNAAKETADAEALRILALLETHHRRLASIIRLPPTRVAIEINQELETVYRPLESRAKSPLPSVSAPGIRSASPAPSTSTVPIRTTRRRPHRDPVSSIATNLATARGILGPQPRRGSPASAAISAANALATTSSRNERQSRAETPESPLTARNVMEREARKAGGSSVKADDDKSATALVRATSQPEDRFEKFYNNFQLGNVFSMFSAPLAFAGLPLNPSSAPPAPTASTKSGRPTATSEPDYTSLISRPALRALKEDQGPSGPFGAAESFYVVPTSGGTVSYAGILTHQHQHAHPHTHPHAASQGSHLPDLIEEDTSDRGSNPDEFVDAVETPYPPSPTSPRHVRRHAKAPSTSIPSTRTIPAGRGTGRKTMEELELENQTLRGLLDKQSRRLQMWEASSQSQSLALAQSFRARGPPSISGAVSDPSLTALLDLQMQATNALNRDKEKMMRENDRLQRVLDKYREQWEKLKAGARKKVKEREMVAGAQMERQKSGEGVAEEVGPDDIGPEGEVVGEGEEGKRF
ncbi:hypothetical protein K432DRAFT_355533 [Lepidopterella palustris CBS 459.81]|uniref:Uncharacterized protein n=1 Tax=Lepidopterella palustris CBS 459.81 TaxID=1314670 RepID=A0A8E2E8F6_9PEZI|nr:hypothetical protein K432DRAFT_355533 [Lepidopterella palustris CBS 459.81]